MCKAGFAGDDAPRAVFRKFSPPTLFTHRTTRLTASQLPLSADPVTMGMHPPRARRRGHPVLTAAQYHDRYGSEGLLRR